MDQSASYGLIAATRSRELGTRVGLGAFIALAAAILHPSWIPPVWFALMVTGQLIDLRIAKAVIARAGQGERRLERIYLASSAINALAWGALDIYLWLACGVPGQWFALLVACGGLVHAAFRLYPVRAMLYACGLPHTVYLLGLPIASAVLGQQPNLAAAGIVFLGTLLYIGQMIGGSRRSEAGLASLRAATDEAERASAAKSEFLATVSHEIRTPMNAVLSAAHLLKRTDLSPEQAEHVAMLTHAGDVLMSLLNDVLDISKIEAGKMEIESAGFDLNEGLVALVALWEPQAQAKGVSLRLEAAADLPARVRTDPLRLRQILFNLLSNAVKFTESGQIVLRAGRQGERLWFEVADSGCGIDVEAQARLFTNFEQADAGLSRRYGGTGLGLAISRRLAEMMGGALTLVASTSAGATFRFETPLVVDEVKASQSLEVDSEAGAEAAPLSILVAEDHEVNRRIVVMFLQPMGWRLTMVENGLEAVEAAKAEAFDVILMDMQMPLMSGVEAAQAIRDGGGLNAQTPVVALTANALGHHRDMWTAVGVDAFLTKPIDPRLLVSTLAAAGARKQSGQPRSTQAA